jgi:hypothetical protein
LKKSTSSGLDPPTFLLGAKCLSQLCYHVSYNRKGMGRKRHFQMGLRRTMIDSLIPVVIAVAGFFSNPSQSSFSSLYHPCYLL